MSARPIALSIGVGGDPYAAVASPDYITVGSWVYQPDGPTDEIGVKLAATGKTRAGIRIYNSFTGETIAEIKWFPITDTDIREVSFRLDPVKLPDADTLLDLQARTTHEPLLLFTATLRATPSAVDRLADVIRKADAG